MLSPSYIEGYSIDKGIEENKDKIREYRSRMGAGKIFKKMVLSSLLLSKYQYYIPSTCLVYKTR